MKIRFHRHIMSVALLILAWAPPLLAAGIERPLMRPIPPVTGVLKTPNSTLPAIQPALPGSVTSQATGTADLLIQSAQWSAPPAAGQQLGRNSILNITVRNGGHIPAPATSLLVSCEALAGGPCPPGLAGTLNVPSLGLNQSHAMAYPAMSSSVWAAGKYRLMMHLDAQNQVSESNEANNKLTLAVDIALPMPAFTAIGKDARGGIIAPQSVAAERLPSAGQGGMQGKPKATTTLTPVSAIRKASKIEAKAQQPAAALRVERASTAVEGGGMQVEAQTAATDQIVLQDFEIKSLRHEPDDPHVDEPCKLLASVENRVDKVTKLSIYARCKPLDGGSCPGGAPGQEVVQQTAGDVFYGAGIRDIALFGAFVSGVEQTSLKGTGRFLISTAKDAGFSKNLLIDMVTVPLPEDAAPAIRRLCYDRSENDRCAPLVETAGNVTKMAIKAAGVGFNTTSKLFCRNNGIGGNTTELATKYIQSANGPGDGTLSAFVPANVVNTPGQYFIWARSADGKESNKEPLEIDQPGQPPQIYEWSPKVISAWGGQRSPRSYYVRVDFKGKNIGPLTSFWLDPSVVASDLHGEGGYVTREGGLFEILLSTSQRPKDGEIKVWIYNRDPNPSVDTRDKAQWVNLQVKTELVPLPPPAILTPAEGESFVMQDVDIAFQGQMPYVLEFQWQLQANQVWLPVQVMPEFDTSGGSVRKLTVQRGLFPNNGTYRLRARISPEEDDQFGKDYVWGAWRVFKIKKN